MKAHAHALYIYAHPSLKATKYSGHPAQSTMAEHVPIEREKRQNTFFLQTGSANPTEGPTDIHICLVFRHLTGILQIP